MSICLSDHAYKLGSHLDGFSWNVILETFMKICPEKSDLVKTEWKYQALYVKT